ncbi:glycine zipper family protein [Candidatus Nitrospira bockiana]
MMRRVRGIRWLMWILLPAVAMAGCGGPKPVLYPNAHLERVGKEAAEQDIKDCRQMAEAAGARPGESKAGQVAGSTAVGAGVGAASGAVGGAISGAAGSGSAIGAATGATWGLLSGLFRRPHPGQAYINFVNRCLREKGYEPVGWE